MEKILPEYLSYWTTEKVKAEGVNVSVDQIFDMFDWFLIGLYKKIVSPSNVCEA